MIQIELSPEVEQQVIETARARSLEPSAYASKLVADAVALTSEKRLSSEETANFLERMASHSHEMPLLSDYAYTRESFYEDHD